MRRTRSSLSLGDSARSSAKSTASRRRRDPRPPRNRLCIRSRSARDASGSRRDSNLSEIAVRAPTSSTSASSAHVRNGELQRIPSTSTMSDASTASVRPVTPGRRMRLHPLGTPMLGDSLAARPSDAGRGSPSRTAAVGPHTNAWSGRARTKTLRRWRSVASDSSRVPEYGASHLTERRLLGDSPCARPSATVNAEVGPVGRCDRCIRRSCRASRMALCSYPPVEGGPPA
ncbi:hypothetical protein RKD05_002077 [Microbacterium sp. SLBN-111]